MHNEQDICYSIYSSLLMLANKNITAYDVSSGLFTNIYRYNF